MERKSVAANLAVGTFIGLIIGGLLTYVLLSKSNTENNLFGTWNQQVTINNNNYSFGTFPDTFDSYINFTASSPVKLMVFTPNNYALYQANKPYIIAYEVTGSNQSWWWNMSSGCDGYVYIILSQTNQNVIIYPNFKVKYNPSQVPTGFCADSTSKK